MNTSISVSIILVVGFCFYFLALLGSAVVMLDGRNDLIKLITCKIGKLWKLSILILVSLSGVGFYWGEKTARYGSMESFLTLAWVGLFHLSAFLLIVYLFVFVPLRIFKINRSEASMRFVSQLNLVLFPFAALYFVAVIIFAYQSLGSMISINAPAIASF